MTSAKRTRTGFIAISVVTLYIASACTTAFAHPEDGNEGNNTTTPPISHNQPTGNPCAGEYQHTDKNAACFSCDGYYTKDTTAACYDKCADSSGGRTYQSTDPNADCYQAKNDIAGIDIFCPYDDNTTKAATCTSADDTSGKLSYTDPTTGTVYTGQAACFAKAGQAATDASTKLSGCASVNTTVGGASISAGTMLIVSGLSASPFGWPQFLSGLGLVAVGAACLVDASKETGESTALGKVAQQDGNLLAGLSGGSGSGNGTIPDTKFTIDPSFIPNADQFKNATGMSVEDFTKGLNAGKNPLEMIANAPNFAGHESEFKEGIGKVMDNPTSKSDALAQLGISPDSIKNGNVKAAIANATGTPDGSGGAGGGSRKLASVGTDYSDLFANKDENPAKAGAAVGGLSPEVRAAMAKKALQDRKNGQGDLSLFQTVHNKYQEKVGMIWGLKKVGPAAVLDGISSADGRGLAGANKAPAAAKH